jgi:hypothetical protein
MDGTALGITLNATSTKAEHADQVVVGRRDIVVYKDGDRSSYKTLGHLSPLCEGKSNGLINRTRRSVLGGVKNVGTMDTR